LHVLRRRPEDAGELIALRLVDRGFFASSYETRLLHEYALLLRDQFEDLPGDRQRTILEWIGEGPDLELVKKRYEENVGQPFTEERADLYRKHWLINRLA
jgi:hypothetical protein